MKYMGKLESNLQSLGVHLFCIKWFELCLNEGKTNRNSDNDDDDDYDDDEKK